MKKNKYDNEEMMYFPPCKVKKDLYLEWKSYLTFNKLNVTEIVQDMIELTIPDLKKMTEERIHPDIIKEKIAFIKMKKIVKKFTKQDLKDYKDMVIREILALNKKKE